MYKIHRSHKELMKNVVTDRELNDLAEVYENHTYRLPCEDQEDSDTEVTKKIQSKRKYILNFEMFKHKAMMIK